MEQDAQRARQSDIRRESDFAPSHYLRLLKTHNPNLARLPATRKPKSGRNKGPPQLQPLGEDRKDRKDTENDHLHVGALTSRSERRSEQDVPMPPPSAQKSRSLGGGGGGGSGREERFDGRGLHRTGGNGTMSSLLSQVFSRGRSSTCPDLCRHQVPTESTEGTHGILHRCTWPETSQS
mmetsp:Transcript_38814/g.92789  ORF Transcript_38814/g.92789 Transcript_38814/m.92789 type:complete len:179 (+) Transcript_38814:35-571(+)